MEAFFVKECTATKSANGREYCNLLLVSESLVETRCYLWEFNGSLLWHILVFDAGLPQPNASGFVGFKLSAISSDLGVFSPDSAEWSKFEQWQRFIPMLPAFDSFRSAVVTLLKEWMPDDGSESAGGSRGAAVALLLSELPELYKSYRDAFGGKKQHHAYRGGLLQHVFEMLTFAFGLRRWFPWPIDMFVLTFGILYHDYGKVSEYVSDSAEYTEDMILWPHPVSSAFVFRQKYESCGMSEALMQRILHCIISHNGRKEWCVAQLPSTIEAFVLSELDLLSAWGATISSAVNMDFVSGMDRRVVNSIVGD